MSTTPTLIYALSSSNRGTVPMEMAALGGAAQSYGPFPYGGNLYACLQTVGSGAGINPARIFMFKSGDSGATWSILDQANGPTLGASAVVPPNGSAYYDGADTVTVCYNSSTVSGAAATAIKFQDFDLVSGTWGAIYGTAGAPSAYSVNQVFARSDGSVVVFHNRTLSGGSGRGVTASVFSAGVWGADFDIDTNAPAGFTSNSASSAVYDPATDIIHVFMQTKDAGNVTGVTYQQINLDNSLGAFTNFTAEFGNLGTTQSAFQAMTNPIIVGGNIVLGVLSPTGNRPSVLVGTPVAAPVWSVLAAPGIDSTYPGDALSNTLQPYLTTDGTTIYAIYAYLDGSVQTTVRLAQTTNTANPLLGWTGEELYADAGGLVPFAQYPSALVAGTTLLMSIQAGSSAPTGYYLSLSIGEPLAITCGDPPAGRVGVAYSHTFPASGGTAPYTYAITSGALLNGLTLDPDTGEVSGTPTIPGTGFTTFTVTVTDAVAATSSVSCSIVVLPAALKITFRGVRRMQQGTCEPERQDAPEREKRKGRVM